MCLEFPDDLAERTRIQEARSERTGRILADQRQQISRAVLARVRLKSLHANKALLGFGWAATEMKDAKLALYGLDHGKSSFDKEINALEETDIFGRKCLAARRLLGE